MQRSVEVFPLRNHVLVFVIAWQAQTTASYDIQDHAGRLGKLSSELKLFVGDSRGRWGP